MTKGGWNFSYMELSDMFGPYPEGAVFSVMVYSVGCLGLQGLAYGVLSLMTSGGGMDTEKRLHISNRISASTHATSK